jgi:predicted Zn-dependent peptidase
MFMHSRFAAEEIEREKGVIVEEINMYVDTPRDLIGQVFDRARYGDSPLGRPILGSKDTVRGATRETFTDYLDTWYQPERIVVGLGGAVSPELLDDARARFGVLAARATPAPPALVLPAVAGPRIEIERRDSDQAHLVLGAGGLPLGDRDRYVAAVLAVILGGGMSSRLFTEVRERRGLAYYVFAHHASYIEAGTLCVQAGVDVGRLQLAVETIWGELRRCATEPVPAEELAKAKRYLTGRTVLGTEDPRGMILYGLRREIVEGRFAELDEVFAGLEAVTASDVMRLAGTLVTPEQATLAVVGPFDDDAPLRDALAA